MAHNRKLVLSGVALTTARNNRNDIEVGTEIMNELGQIIIESEFLNEAPFRWVGLTLRYGLKDEDGPHYDVIDENDGELPVAIELDTRGLQAASREELKELFMIATLKSLIDIGKRYQLPLETFSGMLVDLQTFRAARAV
jgi:hypothetical protein